MKKHLSKFYLPFSVLCLFALAFFVRRLFFFANTIAAETETFFTLESAMFFRYIRMIVSGTGVPVWDSGLEYPLGVFPFKIFSLWAEYIYAWMCSGALWLGINMTLYGVLSVIIPAFFSLGAVFLFFAVRAVTGRNAGAFCAGAFYALTLPAVIRSAGIEISNENIALPLVCLHLWLFFAWHKKTSLALEAVSAVVLAVALCAWDLVQLYINLFFVVFFVMSWRMGDEEKSCRFILAQITGLLGVGIWSGYLRSHGFFLSFPFWLCAVFSLAVLWRKGIDRKFVYGSGLAVAGLAVFCCFAPGLLGGGDFSSNYSHFSELFFAKLRFLNIRPEVPELMSMSTRLLWTPALHSAHFGIVVTFFSRLILLVFLALAGSACVREDFFGSDRTAFVRRFMLYMTLVCGLLFVMFFRLHVYTALFGALVAGFIADGFVREYESAQNSNALFSAGLLFPAVAMDAGKFPGWVMLGWFVFAVAVFLIVRSRKQTLARTLVLFFAVAGFLCAEAAVTIDGVGKWTRRFYYGQAEELAAWCRNNTDKDAVFLADFGLSPCLLDKTGRAVVLHPKFETPFMRGKVEEWAAALFSEDEKDFYGFCKKNRVDYYIHSRGTWSDTSPYSWRYITNTLSAQAEQKPLTCFKFEKRPKALRYFFQVYSSSKYDVFRVLTPALLERSNSLAEQGLKLLEAQRDKEAQENFLQALNLYPDNSQALLGLSRSLNRQGRTREGAEYAKRALSLMLGQK